MNVSFAEVAGVKQIRIHDFRHINHMKTSLLNHKYNNNEFPVLYKPHIFICAACVMLVCYIIIYLLSLQM